MGWNHDDDIGALLLRCLLRYVCLLAVHGQLGMYHVGNARALTRYAIQCQRLPFSEHALVWQTGRLSVAACCLCGALEGSQQRASILVTLPLLRSSSLHPYSDLIDSMHKVSYTW